MKDLSHTLSQIAFKKQTHNQSGIFAWNLALVVFVGIVGAVYLFQVNWLGTQGYRVKQLEQKIVQLEDDRKLLEVEVSNLQSIARIQEEASRLQYVPAANIIYMNDSGVAIK